jgi:hypothetical protein
MKQFVLSISVCIVMMFAVHVNSFAQNQIPAAFLVTPNSMEAGAFRYWTALAFGGKGTDGSIIPEQMPGDFTMAPNLFTPNALENYRTYHSEVNGSAFGINAAAGQKLSNEQMVDLIKRSTVGPLPSDLATNYEIGRLGRPNYNLMWFSRAKKPNYPEEGIYFNGKLWAIHSCGNLVKPKYAPQPSTYRPPTNPTTQPQSESDDLYIVNTNTNTNTYTGGGTYTREIIREVQVPLYQETQVQTQQQVPQNDPYLSLRRQEITLQYVKTGLDLANTFFNGVNTYRGYRFEEQQNVSKRYIRNNNGGGYNGGGGGYNPGPPRNPNRYPDFQGGSPANNNYAYNTGYNNNGGSYYGTNYGNNNGNGNGYGYNDGYVNNGNGNGYGNNGGNNGNGGYDASWREGRGNFVQTNEQYYDTRMYANNSRGNPNYQYANQQGRGNRNYQYANQQGRGNSQNRRYQNDGAARMMAN